MHLELRCGAVGMCVRKKKEIWCTGVRAFQVGEQCAVNSTFLLSSSEAFSISIGNRISCTGAGYLMVIVLPSGSTASVGYCLVYRDLFTLVTAHLFAFNCRTGMVRVDGKGQSPWQILMSISERPNLEKDKT